MSDLSHTRLNTIHALLEGYNSLSVPTLMRPLSAEFTHHVLPRSLGMPVRNKESFSHHAAGIFSIFDRFRLIGDEIYEDEAQGVVVIHARMEGILKGSGSSRRGSVGSGTGKEWRNECIMAARLSEDGTEVVEIQEFVDSAKAMELKRKHAPRDFGGVLGEGGDALAWARNTMLFTCVAAGAYYGVRRFMRD